MVCINVLVISDEAQALRCNVHAVLAHASLRLAGAVSNGRAARTLLDVTMPDVLLVDCRQSEADGIDLVRHAAQHHPCCAVLMVASQQHDDDDDDHAAAALAAGAAGCLSHLTAPERIAASILEAHVDGLRSKLAMQGHLLPRRRGLAAASAATAPAAARILLTARETEILRLIEKGLPFDTVSELLDISPHTVVAHLRKIYRRLAVHTRGEAVHEASQMGLL